MFVSMVRCLFVQCMSLIDLVGCIDRMFIMYAVRFLFLGVGSNDRRHIYDAAKHNNELGRSMVRHVNMRYELDVKVTDSHGLRFIIRPRFFVFYLVDKLSCKGRIAPFCVWRLAECWLCLMRASCLRSSSEPRHAPDTPALPFDPSTCWVPAGTDGFYIVSAISACLGEKAS